VGWDGCRFDLCNQDGDDNMDSDACYYVGSFFACLDEAGECVPDDVTLGTGTCGSAADCLTNCESLADGDCVLACVGDISDDSAAAVSSLMYCAVTACGTQADELTPECLSEVYATTCSAEFAACGGDVTPTEVCDNTTDDDGDGDVDCDDSDCAEDAACGGVEPSVEPSDTAQPESDIVEPESDTSEPATEPAPEPSNEPTSEPEGDATSESD
jgi:hypothetical protein